MRPIGLIACIFAFCVGAPSFAQDAKQIEAAKKDGKLVVYGTMQSDIRTAAKGLPQETSIAVDYWRTSATKVMERALSEARAGKALLDLVMATEDTMRIMLKEGILAKYDSPMNRDFPKDAIDPDLGPRARNHIVGIVYNKSIINPADAPKTLEDLVKPQYRGKLVMADPTLHTTTAQWLVNVHKLIGKEKADKFVRDLAAMKPTLVESFGPGRGPRHLRRNSDRHQLCLLCLFERPQRRATGLRPYRQISRRRQLPTLFHKAPHPNAAKAFIDFFLDEESMTTMAKAGEFVNRKGVFPPVPDADKIQFVEMDDLGEKLYAEKRKEFQKLFLR